MQIDPNNIYQELVVAGETWADAHEAAELLAETKKTILSELSTECPETSMAAKESFAFRHPEYKEFVNEMVKAIGRANRAKVLYDAAKVKADLIRTQAANERATLRSAP